MLTRIHIKNFKSFRDLSVELALNSVLVGPNMVGKSNFIDFFRFFKELLFSPQAGVSGLNNALNARNGFAQVTWRGESNPLIEFTLEGSSTIQSQTAKWRYDVAILGNFQWGGAQVQRENLTITDGRGAYTLIDTQNQQRRLFKADGTQVSEVMDSNRLGAEFEFPGWEGSLLRQSVASWKFYNLLPPMMRQANPAAASTSLNMYGENLSAWLMLLQTRYPESFERIKNAAQDVFPNLQGLFTNPTPQSTVFLSSFEKHLQKPITVTEMSDGELSFLAILSLLYAPDEYGSEIYFVEEPENHLHPKLLSVLVGLLRQVQSERPPHGRAQILISTHSPYLVDKFMLDELIIVKKTDGATAFVRPGDQKQLRDFMADAEIGLGELYYSGALLGA